MALNESGKEKDGNPLLMAYGQECLAAKQELVPDKDSFEKVKKRLEKNLKKKSEKQGGCVFKNLGKGRNLKGDNRSKHSFTEIKTLIILWHG